MSMCSIYQSTIPRGLFSTLFLLLPFVLGSCGTSDPTRVEEDFGYSVKKMIEQQTIDPDEPVIAGANSIDGLDGQSVANTLESYRAEQKRREARNSPTRLNLEN